MQQNQFLIPRNLLILEIVFSIMNFQCVSHLSFPTNIVSLQPLKKIYNEEFFNME